MYPERELIRLAAYKTALGRDIDLRRRQCAAAAIEVARPLQWLDRAAVWWRRVAPFVRMASVPLGLLLVRKLVPRPRIISPLLRWGPVLWSAVRHFRSARATAAR